MKAISTKELPRKCLRRINGREQVQSIGPEWKRATLMCGRVWLAFDFVADAGNFSIVVMRFALSCVAFEPRYFRRMS